MLTPCTVTPTIILTGTDSIIYSWVIDGTVNNGVLKSTFPSLHTLLKTSKITLLYNLTLLLIWENVKLK